MTNQLTILGSAAAVADTLHDHAHLVVEAGARTVLVDCGGNPIINMQKAGIEPLKITDVILTHFHPDHVSGFALLMMDLWLLGRKTPMRVHGLAHCMERARQMMNLYDWENWPGFFDITYVDVASEERAVVANDDDTCILASPTKHLIPSIGLRVEFKSSGKTLVYSSDTEPCKAVEKLAAGADLLLHEASGGGMGHSSAEQAGMIAERAGVKILGLIHYPPSMSEEELTRQAHGSFPGKVIVCWDGMRIDMGKFTSLPGRVPTHGNR